MNRDPGGPGWGLCAGIMLIICGVLSLVKGKPGIHIAATGQQIPLVDWIGWVLLPSGIAISILSIQWLLRGGGKPKKYTNEDVVRAKEKLDQITGVPTFEQNFRIIPCNHF